MSEYIIDLKGDSGVGKTSLVRRLLYKSFNPFYMPTNGIETHNFTLTDKEDFPFFKDGYTSLVIRDHSGIENYFSRTPKIEADYTIVMFDLTSKLSFKNAIRKIRSIRNQINDMKVILCGNKSDIEIREVKIQDIIEAIDEMRINYIQMSCRENIDCKAPLDFMFHKTKE